MKRAAFAGFAAIVASFTMTVTSSAANAAAKQTGEPQRRAATGHISNYDEAKVGPYTLPDPLVLADGERVTTSDAWLKRGRAAWVRTYEREVFGRVPESVPAVRTEVLSSGDAILDGAGIRKHIVLHFGDGAGGPKADVVLYLPAKAKGPVPLLLHVVFLRGLPSETSEPPVSDEAAKRVGARADVAETASPAEVLGRGYAYATFRYTDVQPDAASTHSAGVQALGYRPGQTAPTADEWGTIGVWAWAASRVYDCLATDPAIDGKRVALIGHSRLGKTALWASALDPRFALVFASCSGEMGAALSRRDFGETIDDIAAIFPWWFAGNFQKYIGHWQALPVDAHTLIALSAPRPVFLTGGTQDQWADPKGEFLAAVAAEPVYRLFGAAGVGRVDFPPADTPVIDGKVGWYYHTGPHAITAADWRVFLDFADRHLKR